MKYSHRFFLYAPVAVIVALALAVTGYWFTASNAFAKRLDALNGHDIAPGVSFQFASKSIAGFPFRVDAVLENMRITVATPDGPASWEAEHFALHMLDYGALKFVFEAAGKQTLAWHDAKRAAHGIVFTPALLRASADAGGGRLKRFDIELYGAGTALFAVAHTEFHIRRDPNSDAIDLAFMADKVHLAPELSTAMGATIAKLRLKGTLAPASAWNDFFSGGQTWRKAAEAFHARHGGFAVDRIEVDWGKTQASGKGALTLDDANRPRGLIKLQIGGYQALAAEAERRHLVHGAEKGVFAGLMAEAAQHAKGAEGTLPVTLAFKDGLTYIGDTPVGFVDPLY
jgi:hypothetical protein